MNKIALISIVTGVAGTAVAVPVVVTKLNTTSFASETIFMGNLPQKEKVGDNCQMLTKDNNEKKYLLVCNFDSSSKLEFFFFSGGGGKTLSRVSKFADKADQAIGKITFSLSSDGTSSSGEDSILASAFPWINSIIKTGLNDCELKNEVTIGYPWIIQCKDMDSVTPNISLTPLIIK